MQISQDLKELPLHDAIVGTISYHLGDKTLVIKLQFADEEDAIGESGTLAFFQVENLKSNPPLEDIDWDDYSADILYVGHRPDLDHNQLEGVEALISLEFSSDFYLEFLASHFLWTPES